MGTGFDDFRPLAHHGRSDLPATVQRNRAILLGLMTQPAGTGTAMNGGTINSSTRWTFPCCRMPPLIAGQTP